jgi:hypothetical protein
MSLPFLEVERVFFLVFYTSILSIEIVRKYCYIMS